MVVPLPMSEGLIVTFVFVATAAPLRYSVPVWVLESIV